MIAFFARRFQRIQGLASVWLLMITVMISFMSHGHGLADEPTGSQRSERDENIQKLKTTDGVEFGYWGRTGNRSQPTLIVLASTVEETLASAYFRQCGNQLARESGWLCVSIDLPCHGTRQRDGENGGLSGWRMRVENGEDFVQAFNQQLSSVLDYLIDNGYSDPKRIAACGTSRGGFLAVHFAASESRVGCVAGFAPVTDLAMLSEFKGLEENVLTKELSLANQADKLAGRPVWIGIGDQDRRVSTDSAIRLARTLTTAHSTVDLHVFPEPRGHTTPPGAPEMVARWILSASEK